MIELGTNAIDNETGFAGVVTARVGYLYDNPQVLLEGVDSTGRPCDYWVNESRIEFVE